MDKIVVNLNNLSTQCSQLKKYSEYYASKTSTFSSSVYRANDLLSTFLSDLQQSYTKTSDNITLVNKLLTDYKQDVESLESLTAAGTGNVSIFYANSLALGLNSSIKNVEISSEQMFEIIPYSYASGKDVTVSSVLASGGVCVLSFLEGFLNVGESILDAGAILISGGLSLLGLDGASESLNEFIATDWTKVGYNALIEKTGLDEYSLIDPNGTIANIFSIAGNITGMVTLSAFGGSLGSMAGSSAFTGGASLTTATNTATKITTLLGAGYGATTALGSEAEVALQSGATTSEALLAGGSAAATGFVFGGIGGRFDAIARQAQGLGQVVTNAMANFVVSSAEPVVNEIINTAIYRNDESLSFLENLTNNFANNGIIYQMLIAGGTGAAGTLVNGYLANIERTQIAARVPIDNNGIPILNHSFLPPNDIYSRYEEIISQNPILFYQENLDYFNKNLVSFEDYAQNANIEISSYNIHNRESIAQLCLDFNDKNLLLYHKAQTLLNNPDIDENLAQQITDAMGKPVSLVNADGRPSSKSYYTSNNIDEDALQSILYNYFTPNEQKVLNTIGQSSLRSGITTQEQRTLYQFTRAGGSDINLYLRGDSSIDTILEIEQWLNYTNVKLDGGNVKRLIEPNENIVDQILEVINRFPNKNTVQGVRYLNNNSLNFDLDNLQSYIGYTYTDAAFGSFNLLQGVSTAYSRKPIKMLATINPGSGTFIQGVSGLSGRYSEFLVKPGFRVTITDAYYDLNEGVNVFEVLVSAPN